MLNAWKTSYGTIPKPVKRGVADALQNLTENGYLKWNGKTEKGQISLTDAIRIVHPQPKDEHQSALFDFIVNDHENEDRKALLLSLPVIQSREAFNALSIKDKVAALTGDDAKNLIKSARLTHETIFSSLGKLEPVDAQRIWLKLIPDMGYQAILMNLRRLLRRGFRTDTYCIGQDRPSDGSRIRAATHQLPQRLSECSRHREALSGACGGILAAARS